MQRVLPSRTANANEVSVNNDNNEQFETSDSRSNAGPSSSEVSRPRAEQNRRLASCIGTEQSTELASRQSAEHQNSREPSPEAHIETRYSMDSIPEITRPSRQEVDSPRSINTGDRLEGVNYSERSQSSEASSRRISRRKSSKKDSHRRHSDNRDTHHRSRDYNQSRSERKGRSRHFDSHDDRRRDHRSDHRHDDCVEMDDNPNGNRDNYSHDERGRNDNVNQYYYDYNNRNSGGYMNNNMSQNYNNNYPRQQNGNDYQSRDQFNGYNDGYNHSANYNSGQGGQSSNRNYEFQDDRHQSQRGENRDGNGNNYNYSQNSGNRNDGRSNQNSNQSFSNDQRREENNQPPRDSQREDDHQRDDQQEINGQESQNDPPQEEDSAQQSPPDEIPCVDPLNTSAAIADPIPEVANTSQPDQQNRVGGPFNTVRYERADALKQVSFNTTRAEVLQIIANLRSVFSTYHHSECIAVEYRETFLDQLQLHYKTDATMRDSCEEWQDWGVDKFIANLEALWPQNPEPTDMTFLQAVKAWKFCYDISDESIVKNSCSELLQIHSRYGVREEGDDAQAVKLLREKLNVPDKTNWQMRFSKIEPEVNVKLPVSNIKDFRYVLMWMFKQLYKEYKEWTTSLHMVMTGTANSKSLDSKKSKVVEAKKAGDKPKPPLTTCTMCGRFYHEKDVCPETSNKYANRTNSPYIGSAGHALLVKETGQKGWIPKPAKKPTPAKRADVTPAPSGATGSKPLEKKKDWKDNKSKLLYSLSPSSSLIDPNLLSVTLSSSPKKTSVKARVEALLDTGSLAGDFISEKTVRKYNFTPIQTNSKLTVCSGLDNTCQDLNTKVNLGVTFHNELLNNDDTFDI